MKLSVVVPVRGDRRALVSLLDNLQTELTRSPPVDHLVEILIVTADARESDQLCEVDRAGIARLGGCDSVRIFGTKPGRGLQLDAGVQAARGEWIWMLHADTQVPRAAIDYLLNAPPMNWGRFDVRLDIDSPGFRMIARSMNARSRLTGICTGDQGIFVHASLIQRVGGVAHEQLMEDIELSRRLRRLCHPLFPPIELITSARRWQRNGLLRTILSMWWFRLRYWAGVSPAALAREYYPDPGSSDG